MIRVGVTENVLLTRAELNEQGTLVIAAAEVGTEIKEKKTTSLADMLNEGEDTSGNTATGEVTFLMFPPNLKDFDDKDKDADPKKVLQGFLDLKNQLSHFLKRFMTSKQIKWNILAGTGINAADDNDVLAKIGRPDVAAKVYSNIATGFIQQVTPYLNFEGKPARLFLHRRSKDAHFGTLRKKFLDNQPFFEGMEIPVDQSKMFVVKSTATTKFHEGVTLTSGEGEAAVSVTYVPNFSAYELKNGLDDPTVIERRTDAASGAAEEEENVQSLFSAGNNEEASSDEPPLFTLNAGE